MKTNLAKLVIIIFFAVFLSVFLIKSAIAVNIDFVSPTPANATSTTSTNAEINTSITNASNLDTFIWNWNNANYTFYDKNLALMFNFDNVSILGENATYAVDASAYGNNGTLGNGTAETSPTWTASGRYGSALNFDGMYDSVGLNDNLILINTTKSAYTFEAWFMANGLSAINYLFEASGDSNFSYFALRAENTTLNFVYGNYTSVAVHSSAINITTNRWYHMAVVVNPFSGSNNIQMYLDNSLIAQFNDTRKDYYHDATIGARWTGSKGWNGTIDELRLWNRSLSSSEIQQHYYSNFYKYAADKWAFYTNQINLGAGIYTYLGYIEDAIGIQNQTEIRTIIITSILETTSSTNKKCTNECSFGERKCAGDNGYRICGDYDLDNCRDWSETKYCTDGKLCSGGTCKISCNEKWVCDEWTGCENGKKIRVCNDMNNCGTSTSKPEEDLNCLGKTMASALVPIENSLLLFLATGIIILIAIILAVYSSRRIKKRKMKKALAYRLT